MRLSPAIGTEGRRRRREERGRRRRKGAGMSKHVFSECVSWPAALLRSLLQPLLLHEQKHPPTQRRMLIGVKRNGAEE